MMPGTRGRWPTNLHRGFQERNFAKAGETHPFPRDPSTAGPQTALPLRPSAEDI